MSAPTIKPDPRWSVGDTCPWHHSEAVEAEVDREFDTPARHVKYVVLRCPDKGCGRVRGVRRKVVRS